MTHDPDELEALATLVAAGGALAPRRALLEALGSPAAALAAGPRAWRAAGLHATQRRALRDGAEARARLRAWLSAGSGRHVLGWHDPDYPALLREGANPPLALFVQGDPFLLWHPSVAVVGSRGPSAGGRDNASRFAAAFAASGLAVASGLAAGIDAAAHAAALAAGGRTFAVLGTGPDIAYPRGHADLQARIGSAGALVSEHLPGTPARREHFPRRNRILAALALGTVVVEAALRSGAAITARLAAEGGREVAALPGSIHNPLARGCHRLIRDGAALVETPEEVLALLAPMAAALARSLRGRLAAPPSGQPGPARTRLAPGREDPHPLWQALGHDPTDMDQLVSRTGLTAADLSSMLLAMELEGRVVVEHGRYSRSR